MSLIDAKATNEQLLAAYRQAFGSPVGRQVLADLVAYCRGRVSTFDPDSRVHARNEGRRDVLLRIQEFTGLTLEEIYQLRGISRVIAQKEETDD